MIMRLEREKEERRNRRKRAKIEATEIEEIGKPPEEVEKESSLPPSEIHFATSEAVTSAAAGESLGISNGDDSDAKTEPKEDVEAAKSSKVEQESTEVKDSPGGDEKTEEEEEDDYDVERIVDYSWCRETVRKFFLRELMLTTHTFAFIFSIEDSTLSSGSGTRRARTRGSRSETWRSARRS